MTTAPVWAYPFNPGKIALTPKSEPSGASWWQGLTREEFAAAVERKRQTGDWGTIGRNIKRETFDAE